MKKEKVILICNFLCALLLLVALVMQFQPFWICTGCKTHKGVDKEVSIAEYFWLPKHHEPIADDMTDLYRDTYGSDYKDPTTGKKFKFKANYILPSVLPVFVGSIVGIVLCVLLCKKFFVAGIPFIVGIAGIIGHLKYLALQVGINAQNHMILYVVIAAVAAVSLLVGGIFAVQNTKIKKCKM